MVFLNDNSKLYMKGICYILILWNKKSIEAKDNEIIYNNYFFLCLLNFVLYIYIGCFYYMFYFNYFHDNPMKVLCLLILIKNQVFLTYLNLIIIHFITN